jgi:hypothetical protein
MPRDNPLFGRYRYDFVSRSAAGPPLGKRMVAGRVVSDSYGATKQQHTFTVSSAFYV